MDQRLDPPARELRRRHLPCSRLGRPNVLRSSSTRAQRLRQGSPHAGAAHRLSHARSEPRTARRRRERRARGTRPVRAGRSAPRDRACVPARGPLAREPARARDGARLLVSSVGAAPARAHAARCPHRTRSAQGARPLGAAQADHARTRRAREGEGRSASARPPPCAPASVDAASSARETTGETREKTWPHLIILRMRA